MRWLPLLLLVACQAKPYAAPRKIGAAADPTEPCTVACQYRKDNCRMLPDVQDCVGACRALGELPEKDCK